MSADPNIVPDAKFWPEISYEEAIEMASSARRSCTREPPRSAAVQDSDSRALQLSHERRHMDPRRRQGNGSEAEVVGVTSDKKIAKVTC
jgi:aspartokinase